MTRSSEATKVSQLKMATQFEELVNSELVIGSHEHEQLTKCLWPSSLGNLTFNQIIDTYIIFSYLQAPTYRYGQSKSKITAQMQVPMYVHITCFHESWIFYL